MACLVSMDPAIMCRQYALLRASLNTVLRAAALLILTALGTATSWGQPGSNDPTFDPGDVGNGNGDGIYPHDAHASLIQPDGKIITGRYRLNSDGSLDGSFSTTFTGYVNANVLQPDGRIILAGGEQSTPFLARVNPDGTIDRTFDIGSGFPVNRWIRALAVQPDGKVIVDGGRLNVDGSMDTGFDPGSGPNSEVWAMAVRPDNKMLLAGFFTTFDGASHRGLVQLNVDGSVDNSFDNGAAWCDRGPSCTVKISWTPMAPFAEPRGMEVSEELDAPELLLYPNPNNGEQVRIAIIGLDPALEQVSLDVFDVNGRKVMVRVLPVSAGSVDQLLELSNGMSSGYYTVRVVSGEFDMATVQLVVQR